MSKKRVSKPRPYELMFSTLFCRRDHADVQVGDNPRQTLDAHGCRRLAKWLMLAADWIDRQEQKGGER